MHVKIIRDLTSFRQLEQGWKRLSNMADNCSIFMEWEYLQTCLEVSGTDKLFIISVFEGDELIAVLPLYQDHIQFIGFIRYKILRHVINVVNCSEYGGCLISPVYADSAIRLICSTLSERKNDWDLVWLPKQAAWNWQTQQFMYAVNHQSGLWSQTRQKEFSVIKFNGDFEHYLRGLSKKVRTQIRRERRDAFERNVLNFIQCRSENEVQGFLDELFRLHHLRWSAKGQSGTFIKRPNERRFYELFAPLALERGWLRLYLLKQGENAVAAKIGFTIRNTCYEMQGGFDLDSVKGVGNVLQYKAIEASISDDQVIEYDFLGGTSEHKTRWGSEVRLGFDWLIGRKSVKNSLLGIAKVWPGGRALK